MDVARAKKLSKKERELNEVHATIRSVDHLFLAYLYRMRCLSVDMAFRFFYSKKRPYMPYCLDSLVYLVKKGLITIEDDADDRTEVVFLTNLGIQYLFEYVDHERYGITLPEGAADDESKAIKNAKQLRIKDRLLNHQLLLNYFVLEYIEYADEHGIQYEYYDLLFAPKCSERMMPDGVLVLKDRIVLLEMDTGTERQDRLVNRWLSYRSFFAKPEPFYANTPITALFILDNISDSAYRRTSFMKTICASGLISDLGPDKELYAVGTEEAKALLRVEFDQEILNEELIVPVARHMVQNCGFLFYDTAFLSSVGVPPFSYYVCCKAGGIDKPLILDGRPVEFLLDAWEDDRYSVLNKMSEILATEQKLLRAPGVGRTIPYVVVVSDLQAAANVARFAIDDDEKLKNIYFTTPDRVAKGLPFYEMIFTIDSDLRIRHFTDYSLTQTVYERQYDVKHPERNTWASRLRQ